jgi:hypothetical protein
MAFDKSLLGDGMELVSKSEAAGDSIEWWSKNTEEDRGNA